MLDEVRLMSWDSMPESEKLCHRPLMSSMVCTSGSERWDNSRPHDIEKLASMGEKPTQGRECLLLAARAEAL
jgi:hypothetical protein